MNQQPVIEPAGGKPQKQDDNMAVGMPVMDDGAAAQMYQPQAPDQLQMMQ